MKNKRGMILILFLSSLFNLSGQGITSNFYGGCGNDYLKDMVIDPPYIYLYGSSYSFDWGRNIYLCKIDTSGKEIWAKAYKIETGGDRVSCMVLTSKRELLIAGNTFTSLPFIAKIDTNGNVLFSKVISDKSVIINQIITTTNNGVLIACSHSTPLIIRLDSLGDVVYAKNYKGGYTTSYPDPFYYGYGYGFTHSVFQTADDGFIISGVTGIEWFNYPFILKADRNGNIEWSKTYNSQIFFDYELSTVFENSDEGYALCGRNMRKNLANPQVYDWGCDPYILKIDKNGNVISSKTYRNQTDKTLSGKISVINNSGNELIICGTTGTSLFDDGNASSNYFALCVDSSMNLKWSYLYGGNHLNRSVSSIQTGNYIFMGGYSNDNSAGNILSPVAPQTDFYIMKINKDGQSTTPREDFNPETYDFIDDTITNKFLASNYDYLSEVITLWGKDVFMHYDSSNCVCVGIREIATFGDLFRVYPVPATEQITIAFDNYKGQEISIEVYNSSGLLIKKFNNLTCGYVVIDRNRLPSGLYFFKASNKKGLLGNGKILFY